MLNVSVLVLNRSYLPVHVTSARRAFALLYQGIARAVNEQYETFDFDSWAELSVRTQDDGIGVVGGWIRVPRVILIDADLGVPRRREQVRRILIEARERC